MSKSEHWNCDSLPSENLWGVIRHAESQIAEWSRRRDIAIGHLAMRGEVIAEYPTYGEEL